MEVGQCMYTSPTPSDLPVLERQKAHLSWQQQSAGNANGVDHNNGSCSELPFFHSVDNVTDSTKSESHSSQVYNPVACIGGGWPDFSIVHYPNSSTGNGREEANSNGETSSSSKKRKPEEHTSPKDASNASETSASCKRLKEHDAGAVEDKKGTTETQKPSSTKKAASKGHPKESTVTYGTPPKPDYIHVRARRGQATDSHSLAERVRRERISERMKYLQDLVPGCNKIIGKAGMLDEIINYVQSLQRQVEFLSMKLATLNPVVDLGMDNYMSGKINPAFSFFCPLEINVVPAQEEASYLQMSSLQQAQPGTACGLGMAMDTTRMALHSSLNAPQQLADPFFGSCFSVHGSSVWDISLQNNHALEMQPARGATMPFQSPQSSLLHTELKTEM